MEFKFKKIFTKISTSIEMQVFMYTHLLLGNYFKASSFKTVSILLRLYCFFFTLNLSILCSAYIFYHQLNLLSSLTNVCEVIISFISSEITSQKYLVTFANTLNTLDNIIGFKTKSNLLSKTFFLCFTIYIILIICLPFTVIANMTKDSNCGLICFLFAILYITTELRYCKSGIVISLMQHRLNLLKKYIENNDIPVNIIGSEGINERIRVVRKSLIYYDNMLDAFDAIDYFMQFEVVLICAFYLPRNVSYFSFLISSYLDNGFDDNKKCLTIIFQNLSGAFTTTTTLVAVFNSILAFSPSIIMYFCNREIELLKKTLVLQIISSSDVSLREELENLLQHVTRRPFRFTLLRAVSVDLYLPINLISTSITYVIIVLQFTHFGYAFRNNWM